jgi:hypothetical protein
VTTAKQVKQLLAPLLAVHPEMAMIDRVAVTIRPVRHLMYTITIDRTGDAARCRPFWGVSALVNELPGPTLGHGERLFRGQPNPLWKWNDSGLADDLIKAVTGQAMPAFAAVPGLREYFVWTLPEGIARQKFPAGHVLYLLALGDLDEARAVLEREPRAAGYWTPRLEQIGVRDALMRDGSQLSHQNRSAIARLLREREAKSVANLKLEALWEPTPFPIEQVT